MDAETLSRIRFKAEVLAGESLGESGVALVEMACERACAHCQRSDIPPAMEQAVAALCVQMTAGEGEVQALTRGDTSVTYRKSDAMAMLSPFRRLGTAQKEADA